MKRFFLSAALLFAAATAIWAQDTDYKTRYEKQVARVGAHGIGVENILDKWEKADSTNAEMLFARFLYYYTKSQTEIVVSKPEKRYLGLNPVLALKDTTGVDVYYYNVMDFDDSLFRESLIRIEKAIKIHPTRLDFRTTKATALMEYEKESPDMALSYILSVVDENYTRKPAWEFEGQNVDKDFFPALIQEYCGTLYLIGTDSSRKAFKTLSERMLKYNKKNPDFLTNLGSYYIAAKDYKKAFKYYDTVIKAHPDHYTAVKNASTISIQLKDIARQKKYLPLLMECGSQSEKNMAKARLEALNKK
ncbi:MAG: hypothetical protein MJY67_01155 [Bacteroidales bacterium]|nr:hypothetical protein [Bacteroidales bacterium]